MILNVYFGPSKQVSVKLKINIVILSDFELPIKMWATLFLTVAFTGAAGGIVDLQVNIQAPDNNTPFVARDCRQSNIRLYRRDEICAPADNLEPSRGWFKTVRLSLVTDTRFQCQMTRRCTHRVTTHYYICGAYSHMIILGPPTIAELVRLSALECSHLIDTQMYTTEHGVHLPLRQGEEINYQYVAVGRLHRTHDDVTCYGDAGYYDGSTQSAMVQTKSVAIRVDQVTLHEHDGFWYDTAAETFLPLHCNHQRTCQAFGRAKLSDAPTSGPPKKHAPCSEPCQYRYCKDKPRKGSSTIEWYTARNTSWCCDWRTTSPSQGNARRSWHAQAATSAPHTCPGYSPFFRSAIRNRCTRGPPTPNPPWTTT